jgi:hypothetical protein
LITLARCGCGTDRCNCSFVAGPGITLEGNGSPGVPVVVSADPPPPLEVANDDSCVTLAGSGTTASPLAAGLRLDPDPANAAVCGPDGLMVPAGGGATVVSGCGLNGNGSTGTPLVVPTGTWPFTCNLDTEGGDLYCDSTGRLRTLPRGRTFFQQQSTTDNNDPTLVPAAYPTEIAHHALTITNPDPCRPMFVICEEEIDVDIDLPPNSGATWGITGDEMQRVANTGSGTLRDIHTQLTKVFNFTVAPGASATQNLLVQAGAGFGGAEYNKVQSFIRAFGIIL